MSRVDQIFEVNFDGLVGPTHNYAGLSFGNRASASHGGQSSSPRKAALQGLEKMMQLQRLGLKQAVLPPHDRPHIPTLRQLGFSGNGDAEILAEAARQAPDVLASVCSASAMWVANAATVSPFPDTEDGRTHFTPANLSSMFHRSIEVETTTKILKSVFRGDDYCHHAALPVGQRYSDEGAANHNRLCAEYGEEGVELFVYGDSHLAPELGPQKYPSRQTRQACEAVVRSHRLRGKKTVLARQNPTAIDAGVFHNDVIAVANKNLLFHHELAFADKGLLYRELDAAFKNNSIEYIEVPTSSVSLEDAIASYLFNSQLIAVPGRSSSSLVVPGECGEIESVRDFLESLQEENEAIGDVRYLDLRESMENGGGPACLRLRVVMSAQQINNTQARVFLDESLYRELKRWIEKHYRTKLELADLGDPSLLDESRRALDELTQLLRLGSLYDFQT